MPIISKMNLNDESEFDAFDLAPWTTFELHEGDPTDWKIQMPRDDSAVPFGLFISGPYTADWTFPSDGIVGILKGRVRLEFDDGEVMNMDAGDIASFPKGLHCKWIATCNESERFKEFSLA